MLSGRDLNIPVVIPMECVKTSEEIIRNSYDHSETFSSVREYAFTQRKQRLMLHMQNLYLFSITFAGNSSEGNSIKCTDHETIFDK